MTVMVDMDNRSIVFYINDQYQCRRDIPEDVFKTGHVHAFVDTGYKGSEFELVK